MGKRKLDDLVIVLLHTENRDIWHFVTKRIKLQVNGRAKLQPTTFCKVTLKKPIEWLKWFNPNHYRVLVTRPEGLLGTLQTDDFFVELQKVLSNHVKACYFLQTSDLEMRYNGELLKSKIQERLKLIEDKILLENE